MSTQQQGVWSFIHDTKATQVASLKILQSFVLSLSKNELRHMIHLYLKSVHDRQQSINKAKNSISQHKKKQTPSIDITLNPIEPAIKAKLDDSYAIKYNKRMIRYLSQKEY